MAFSRGIGNFGVRGPRSAAIAAPWTPLLLPSLVAWFAPGVNDYIDAGSTLAVVEDPVYRRVSVNDPAIYIEQATLANRPILKQGANGKYYSEFDGTNDSLEAADSAWSALNGKTFGFWMGVRADAIGSVQFLVAKDDGEANRELASLVNSSGNLYAEVEGGFAASQTGDALSSETWHVAAIEYDLATEKTSVSIDGAAASTSGGTRVIPDTAAALQFFKRGTGDAFAGRETHIIFVDEILSSEERGLLLAFFMAEEPT